MAERITLRFLLYLVLVGNFVALFQPRLSEASQEAAGLAALLSLGFLAVSAYDPRYSPWIQPPAKRPRED